jgi:PAS domain S-box-containing protein
LTSLSAHRGLRESEERHRVTLQTAMDGFFRTDMRGRILEVNETYCHMTGYSEQELLSMHIADLSVVRTADTIVSDIKRLKELGPERFESVHRRKDGSLFDVEISGQHQPIAGGQAVVFVRDITERKRAEEALRLAGVYNRSLIEASLDPLVTIDPEGSISDVNAATEQVTGYTRSELIGTDFSDYFTEPEKARAGYQQVFNQGFVRDYELEIRNRNGEITPVLYNASVYRDDAGSVIGVFAAARDITFQKEAEAKIAEQRALEEERSRELDRLAELEKFQKLTVGREIKMIELKKEIEEIRKSNEMLQKQLAERHHP